MCSVRFSIVFIMIMSNLRTTFVFAFVKFKSFIAVIIIEFVKINISFCIIFSKKENCSLCTHEIIILNLFYIYDKIKLRRKVITLRRGELAFGLQENYTCLEKKLAKHSIYHFCRCHRMLGNRKYVTY